MTIDNDVDWHVALKNCLLTMVRDFPGGKDFEPIHICHVAYCSSLLLPLIEFRTDATSRIKNWG